MLGVSECQKILNGGKVRYSKEEIDLLREILYRLAEIEHEQFRQQRNEGSSIHSRFDRGASKTGLQSAKSNRKTTGVLSTE